MNLGKNIYESQVQNYKKKFFDEIEQQKQGFSKKREEFSTNASGQMQYGRNNDKKNTHFSRRNFRNRRNFN